MAMIGENQVRNMFVVNTATNSTLANVASGAKVNGAIVSSDGTAAAAGPFLMAYKNDHSVLTVSDVVVPESVTYAKSIKYAPRVEQYFTISDIVVDANTLYEIRVIFTGYGSLSVEDELTISGFYKSNATDAVEDIVDGLVTNLARNTAKMQQAANGTFAYVNAAGTTLQLPDNGTLDFIKSNSDAAKETATFTVTTDASAEGECIVTLDGEAYSLPVSIGASNTLAAEELALNINGIEGYNATSASAVVTVVADIPGVQANASFAAGTATSMACTVATSVQGTAGTDANAQLTIQEKTDWLADYYVTGKKDRLNMDFTVQAQFITPPTIDKNVGDPGHGTGYHVRNMEYYFQGNRGDSMRGAGYPNNFEHTYASVLEDEYFLIELAYFSEGRDDPMKSKKQLTFALPSKSAANKFIADINTSLANTSFSITSFV
jgi:hypothetical protein